MNNEVERWEELDGASRHWLAERYVLLDPTLDREAFEAQMAEQVELALAVAAAVARCQRLSVAACTEVACTEVACTEVACTEVACRVAASPAVVAAGPVVAAGQVTAAGLAASDAARGGWAAWYACGLAIALGSVLIGGSWWRSSEVVDAMPALLPAAQGEGDLTQVVERWLALAPQDANEKDANEKDASESSWDALEPGTGESISALEIVEEGTPEWSLPAEQLAAAEEPDWMLEVAASYFDEAGG